MSSVSKPKYKGTEWRFLRQSLSLIFGLNLHFYIQPLAAWKRKQYLNSKEHKKEEEGAQKTDTQTLPRPSAQDSTRT